MLLGALAMSTPLSMSPSVQLVQWSDNSFQNSDWTKSKTYYGSTFDDLVNMTRRSDGNVGGCVRTDVTARSDYPYPHIGDRFFAYDMFNSATWSLSSGAVSSVDVEMDTRFMSPSAWPHLVLVLKQGSDFYISGNANPAYPNVYNVWETDGFSLTSLTSSYFWKIDPANLAPLLSVHPDFSSTGADLQFGFGFWGDVNGSKIPLVGTLDIDNWKVTLYG